jgi:nitrogen fixation NifU-like protein
MPESGRDTTATLYRELILEHSRHPRNAGRLEHPDLAGKAVNPLCGDELHVTLSVLDGAVGDIRMQVRGCVIAQAAASLVSEWVRGKALGALEAEGAAFRAALEEGTALPESLGGLNALLGVRQHRSRTGCALLPWQALAAAKPPQEA